MRHNATIAHLLAMAQQFDAQGDDAAMRVMTAAAELLMECREDEQAEEAPCS